VLGLFQLCVVTPVSLSQGFTSIASNVVIGVTALLTAFIGVALLQDPGRDASRSQSTSLNASLPG